MLAPKLLPGPAGAGTARRQRLRRHQHDRTRGQVWMQNRAVDIGPEALFLGPLVGDLFPENLNPVKRAFTAAEQFQIAAANRRIGKVFFGGAGPGGHQLHPAGSRSSLGASF